MSHWAKIADIFIPLLYEYKYMTLKKQVYYLYILVQQESFMPCVRINKKSWNAIIQLKDEKLAFHVDILLENEGKKKFDRILGDITEEPSFLSHFDSFQSFLSQVKENKQIFQVDPQRECIKILALLKSRSLKKIQLFSLALGQAFVCLRDDLTDIQCQEDFTLQDPQEVVKQKLKQIQVHHWVDRQSFYFGYLNQVGSSILENLQKGYSYIIGKRVIQPNYSYTVKAKLMDPVKFVAYGFIDRRLRFCQHLQNKINFVLYSNNKYLFNTYQTRFNRGSGFKPEDVVRVTFEEEGWVRWRVGNMIVAATKIRHLRKEWVPFIFLSGKDDSVQIWEDK